MIVSLLTLGLLLIPSSNAFFRLPCAKPVLDARVDPIVTPGKASGHAHTIMGSNAIGLSTTFNDLRNSQCTTCKVKDDKSAYWVPELYYQYKNGSFQVITHGGMIVYYLQRNAANETVEAFPDGLRMLAGNPYLRSNPVGTPESTAITWKCINFNAPDQPETSGFGNTNCPDGLRAQVFFPACWDGVNLDSADHKSHMAYPDGVNNGLCPYTHPHHLISIFYEVWFSVAPFNALNDGGRFVLANGDPTGFGLHGDFFDGWDRDVLSRAVQTCTADSGVIEDCPVFQNEGRFEADADMNSCAATNPIPDEKVAPLNSLLPYLPGCVAVTGGPAPATASDLVPGCGSGALPVLPSPLPQNTSTSPVPSSTPVAKPPSAITPTTSMNPVPSSSPPAKPPPTTTPTTSKNPVPSSSPPAKPPPTTTPSVTPPKSMTSNSPVPTTSSKSPGSVSPTPVPETMSPTTKPSSVPTKDPAHTSSKPSSKPTPSGHYHHHHHHHHHSQDSSTDYCDDHPPAATATNPPKNASTPMRRRHHARRAGHGSYMRL